MAKWKFAKAIEENEEFKINGVNVWNHYWHCVDQKVEVVEPQKGNTYYFREYEIQADDKKINFVAGEFINSKIGIYLKDEELF